MAYIHSAIFHPKDMNTSLAIAITLNVVYLIVINSEANYAKTQDIQTAECKIVAGNVNATANVSVSRELIGVCTAHELDSKLSLLEEKILHEIRKLDEILRRFELTSILTRSASNSKNIDENHHFRNLNNEVRKFNMTTQQTDLGRTYFYYWEIEDVFNVRDEFIESPTFYLPPFLLYIKLFPHHLSTNYIALQLEGVAQGLHYRFTILHSQSQTQDLTSQILGPHARIYRVAHDTIQKLYIKGNRLLLKVAVASIQ